MTERFLAPQHPLISCSFLQNFERKYGLEFDWWERRETRGGEELGNSCATGPMEQPHSLAHPYAHEQPHAKAAWQEDLTVYYYNGRDGQVRVNGVPAARSGNGRRTGDVQSGHGVRRQTEPAVEAVSEGWPDRLTVNNDATDLVNAREAEGVSEGVGGESLSLAHGQRALTGNDRSDGNAGARAAPNDAPTDARSEAESVSLANDEEGNLILATTASLAEVRPNTAGCGMTRLSGALGQDGSLRAQTAPAEVHVAGEESRVAAEKGQGWGSAGGGQSVARDGQPPFEDIEEWEEEEEEEEERGGLQVKDGDLIHCLLDVQEGMLEFRVNGVEQPHRRITGITAAAPDGHDDGSSLSSLWLVVSLCGQGDWVSLYPSSLALRPSQNLSSDATDSSNHAETSADVSRPLGDGSLNPWERERARERKELIEVIY